MCPTLDKLYWKLFQTDNRIEESTLSDSRKKQICQLLVHRWKMLHNDLHSSSFMLDPEYYTFQQHDNKEVVTSFYAMIQKIHSNDIAAQVKAIQ